MLAVTYTITLNQAETRLLVVAVIMALLAWAWGALLKSALGFNRWFGLLIFLPVINLLAFFISGLLAHRGLIDKESSAAYEKIMHLLAEESPESKQPAEAD